MKEFYYYFPLVLYFFFSHLLACPAMTATNITTDQLALLALRAKITLDPHQILANNWSVTSSVCDWTGVTCGSRHRRVTLLNISNLGLTGTLPPQLGNLSFLMSLDMTGNNLYGELPRELIHLRRLRVLDLGINKFSGDIPSWVGSLQELQYFSLENNSFTGFIPPSISNLSKLETLRLSFNSLQGTIPMEIGNLNKLKTVIINSNQLSGSLPLGMFNSSPLEHIAFNGNNLSGSLPISIGQRLRGLTWLDLSVNKFSGRIPSWIGSLQELQYLSLGNNSFTGFIPSSICNMSKLDTLNLQHNSLQGAIPMEMFNISSLEVVAFQGNSLSGSLPVSICPPLQGLTWLDLSLNKLSGMIPSLLSECSKLRVLGLSVNNFTGVIPREYGNLTGLEELYLGDNNLEGAIPQEIGKLTLLRQLSLENSKLTGPIPKEIGNLTMLSLLDVSGARITGKIPEALGNLYRLEGLFLESNYLTGFIPFGIFNLSMIRLMALDNNGLSGNLASSIGHKIPHLEFLNLRNNELEGRIPGFILNASRLDSLALSGNKFSGPIPNTLGDLRLLRRLDLERNSLTSEYASPELSFITSLTNCKYLEILEFSENPLSGILPSSIGNLSTSVTKFHAYQCEIMGNIPYGFGNLTNLLVLEIPENLLTGSVPATFKGLQNLQGLLLYNNRLSGPFPEILCDLQNLFILSLSQNQISGSIPSCIGNLTFLGNLNIAQNSLNSSMPSSLWNLNRLLELDLSSNSLSGLLPEEVQNLRAATQLNLSVNYIQGSIPSSIGDLRNLITLSLAHNRLERYIPDSLGHILSLQFLDLSHNDLSGMIPKSLQALSDLKYMNLSFNNLSGEIPSGGPFKNFTIQSFLSNDALCGSPRFSVPRCSSSPIHRSSRKKIVKVISFSLSIFSVIIAISLAVLFLRCRRKNKVPIPTISSPLIVPERISYYELSQATDGYNERNLLGKGSIGSVYKGTLRNGILVAVKVFNLQLEITHRSFISECEVLRNLRHRNLTKVIGVCSNDDFKALVLEYMPNGSLENWLYFHNHHLDLIQRISIMVDVACALEYLHYGYTIPVVHCDLKPANILLDGDMVAHLCDFGLAKLLSEEQSDLQTKTLATLGYIAPEYGSQGLISTRADVYSYGILLMETFSRMKPSNEMFSGDLNLKSWIESSLHSEILKVIDANLLMPEDQHLTRKLEYISMILDLALSCCKECPIERINMKDVVVSLVKIKHQLARVCRDQL